MKSLRILALVLAGLLLLNGAAQASRFALVVGNAGYAFDPLANPVRDGRLVAEQLAALDFDVVYARDLTVASFDEIIEQSRDKIAGADVFFFYYAGHALQYKGDNRLLMLDIEEGTVDAVLKGSESLSKLINRISDIGPKILVMALDACRDNPIATKGGDLQTGLSYVETSQQEMLIAYATSAGQVAYDGGGANGPYAIALANALAEPDVSLSKVFRDVRRRVREATGGLQIPWVSSSVEREVVLRETQIAAEPPPSVEGANWTERLAEIVWTYIKDRGEASYFETFRRVFSQSSYAQAAAQMLGAAQESRAITVVSAGSTAQLAAAAPATNADWTLAQAEYGTTVDRYPISEMRAWPDQLPAVDDGLATLVTSCDLLAGDPDDPAGVALGVHASLVSTRDAIPACGFAAAAHPDIPRYLFLLGRALDIGGRVDWAIPLYQAAGDRGYSQALTNLGHLYRFGVKVPADYRKSFGYYKRSALIGNPQARMGLAILYQNGWGVQQSIEESMLWARLAGSQGWTNAYDMLATHYVAGRGVAKDDAAAFKLFLFAAQMGQTNAMSNLGLAYLKGEGTPQDEEQGLFWLNKAYASGNRYAAYHLGRRVLKDDPAAAEQYFVISAERDFQEARFELAKLYSAQKNFEEALFQLDLAQRLGLKRDVSELQSSVSGNLDDAARTNVTARVDRWLEDNGY